MSVFGGRGPRLHAFGRMCTYHFVTLCGAGRRASCCGGPWGRRAAVGAEGPSWWRRQGAASAARPWLFYVGLAVAEAQRLPPRGQEGALHCVYVVLWVGKMMRWVGYLRAPTGFDSAHHVIACGFVHPLLSRKIRLGHRRDAPHHDSMQVACPCTTWDKDCRHPPSLSPLSNQGFPQVRLPIANAPRHARRGTREMSAPAPPFCGCVCLSLGAWGDPTRPWGERSHPTRGPTACNPSSGGRSLREAVTHLALASALAHTYTKGNHTHVGPRR